MDVRSDRLRNFFSKHDRAYRIKKEVRDMVVFAIQNVITDPPFSKIDLVSCRNLLIYMKSELQKKILPIFHYSLTKGGFLFLGTSETVGEFSDMFAPVDRKWKVFRRKDSEAAAVIPLELGPRAMAVPAMMLPEPRAARPYKHTNQELIEQMMLDTYPASGLLVNEKADILYFHGLTGRYLHPPVGEASFNALAMARQGLKIALANSIRKAASSKEMVRVDNLRMRLRGEEAILNLIVKPIQEPPSKRGLLAVIFEDVGRLAPELVLPTSDQGDESAQVRIREMEHQLATTKEYLQTTIEELETSSEELKSTNEELQSANEELQSTNEELETAKEEQQSVNEELITVSSELQQKIDALSKSNDDMTNLLARTQIGTIFLDTKLNIQRFTPMAKKIIHLIDSDIGRSVRDMAHNLQYDRMLEDAGEVLRTLNSKEIEVRSKSGTWYTMHILPYRTTQNIIEGVVVTFLDITDRKQAEMLVRESEQRYRSIGRLTAAVWTCTPHGQLTYLSDGFKKLFGYSAEDRDGKKWLEIIGISPTERGLEKVLSDWKKCNESGAVWNHTFTARDRSGKERPMIARVAAVKDDGDEITSWVGVNIDATELQEMTRPCIESPQ